MKNASSIHKKEKCKNRASSCFKLAQMTPWAKISLKLGPLMASENMHQQTHTHRQTRFMFLSIDIDISFLSQFSSFCPLQQFYLYSSLFVLQATGQWKTCPQTSVMELTWWPLWKPCNSRRLEKCILIPPQGFK